MLQIFCHLGLRVLNPHYVPPTEVGGGGIYIGFGADPVGVGMRFSFVQDLLWTIGGIQTKLFAWIYRPLVKSANPIFFFISQPKHMLWVLNETVLLSTLNMLKRISKKIFTFYAKKSCLSTPMDITLGYYQPLFLAHLGKKCWKCDQSLSVVVHGCALSTICSAIPLGLL